MIKFVLHRPRSSQNIGAAARALANTGAGELWVVEPLGFDRAQAAKLAAGADQVLEKMRVVRTLEEALADPGPVIDALTPQVAIESYALPEVFHRDPADRLIVATARVASATLMTRDRRILDYAARGHLAAVAA